MTHHQPWEHPARALMGPELCNDLGKRSHNFTGNKHEENLSWTENFMTYIWYRALLSMRNNGYTRNSWTLYQKAMIGSSVKFWRILSGQEKKSLIFGARDASCSNNLFIYPMAVSPVEKTNSTKNLAFVLILRLGSGLKWPFWAHWLIEKFLPQLGTWRIPCSVEKDHCPFRGTRNPANFSCFCVWSYLWCTIYLT